MRRIMTAPSSAPQGMTRIAVIEDDQPTSDQLSGWIRAARPGIQVDQWFTRDEAESALARERYDVVVLDLELQRERHAGVALINTINKSRPGTPVLVVSAMPATIYRSIMKALDAWDYLQKTTFEVASKRDNPSAVAVDDAFVYWVEGGTPNTKEGAIFKAPKPTMQ